MCGPKLKSFLIIVNSKSKYTPHALICWLLSLDNTLTTEHFTTWWKG